jgi:hypothetical protein
MDRILNPAMIGILMFLASVLWMLQNEKDKSRSLLAAAVMLNLFYGSLLSAVMGHANSLLPWKYDYYLFQIDAALGIPAASIARAFGQIWRSGFNIAYELMVPMMVLWLFLHRRRPRALILAYVAEMLGAPVLYMVLPACGPLYAFGARWMEGGGNVQMAAARFNGMPNAFPSLHLATGLVLAFFAEGKLWRVISMIFLAATALSTLTTGEHYVVDLVGGLAFGCFAAALGRGKISEAASFLGITLAWAVAIRVFGKAMVTTPTGLRLAAILTVGLSLRSLWHARQADDGSERLDPKTKLAGQHAGAL